MRPIENNGSFAEMRKNAFFEVVVPNGAVGVDKEDVATAKAPPRPNGDMQEYRGYEKEQENDCPDEE